MAFLQDWIIPFLVDYGLLAIFITMTLESACVPIPSEIVVPYGGVLAAQGHVTLWAVVLVATLANLVGSSIAYAAGRYGGRALVLRYGTVRLPVAAPPGRRRRLVRAPRRDHRLRHPHDAGRAHLHLGAGR